MKFLRELLLKGTNAFDRLVIVINFGFNSESFPSLGPAEYILKPFVRGRLEGALRDLWAESSHRDATVLEHALKQLQQDDSYFCVNAKAACRDPNDRQTGFPQFADRLDRFLSNDAGRRGFVASHQGALTSIRDALVRITETEIEIPALRGDRENTARKIETLCGELAEEKEKLVTRMEDLAVTFRDEREKLQAEIVADEDFIGRLHEGVDKAVLESWSSRKVSFPKLLTAALKKTLKVSEFAKEPAIKALTGRLDEYAVSVARDHVGACHATYKERFGRTVRGVVEDFSRTVSRFHLTQSEVGSEIPKIAGGIAAEIGAGVVGRSGFVIASGTLTATLAVIKSPTIWWFWTQPAFITVFCDPMTLLLAIFTAIAALASTQKSIDEFSRSRTRFAEELYKMLSAQPPDRHYPEGGILYQFWHGSQAHGNKGLAQEIEDQQQGLLKAIEKSFYESIASKEQELRHLERELAHTDRDIAERVDFFKGIRNQPEQML